MEKGDILGLIGMVLGIQAIMDVVLYFIYAQIPLFESYWGLFMIIFYIGVYAGGIAGLILSIVGVAKNGTKFGIIGIIAAAAGIAIFTIAVLMPTGSGPVVFI